LGIAPANVSDKNLISVGRYEAATKRSPQTDHPENLRMGVDCAGYGKDSGTLYVRWNGAVWRAGRLSKLDTNEYVQKIKAEALRLRARDRGITSLHIRVDGGGGFGAGIIDRLKVDDELIQSFPDFQVLELHFNATPRDEAAFYDAITEWTADVAESLKSLAVVSPPEELQADLCERLYDWRNARGKDVKRLESKEEFRKRLIPPRSPDDGDGFVLAVASDRLFIPDDGQFLAILSHGQAKGW
jgi:hypothetical protein